MPPTGPIMSLDCSHRHSLPLGVLQGRIPFLLQLCRGVCVCVSQCACVCGTITLLCQTSNQLVAAVGWTEMERGGGRVITPSAAAAGCNIQHVAPRRDLNVLAGKA